jgi:hypothetical protein
VIGSNGGAGGAFCAKAGAPKAQVKTATATAFEPNTATSSSEIPFSTARILAKTSPRWQATRLTRPREPGG